MKELTIRDKFGSHISPEEIHTFMQKTSFNSILDVGCGISEKTQYFSEYSSICIGIDIANRCKYPRFINANAEAIPFADNTFDFIICCEVLEHLRNPLSCAKECARVLKDEGILFVLTPVLNLPHTFAKLYRFVLNKPVEDIHERIFSSEEVKSLFIKNFIAIRIKHNIFLYTLIESIFGKKIRFLTHFPELITKLFASEIYLLARRKKWSCPA